MTDPRLVVVLGPVSRRVADARAYAGPEAPELRALEWREQAARIDRILRERDRTVIVHGEGVQWWLLMNMVTTLTAQGRSVVLSLELHEWLDIQERVPAGLAVEMRYHWDPVESEARRPREVDGDDGGSLGWGGAGAVPEEELDVPPPPPRVDRRHVNVVVAAEPRGEPLAGPLSTDATYLARVSIGPLAADTVITDPPAFPHEHLPRTERGWWLTVLATGDALAYGDQFAQSYFLPRAGAGYHCGCERGGDHHCRSRERRSTVDIPVRAGTLRLAVYLEGRVLVQALTVDLPAGGRPAGRVVWSLDVGVADLDRHGRRSASVYEDTGADGRHRLIVGDGTGGQVRFELGEAQAASLARRLRTGLHDAQFDGRAGRFDERNGKGREAYLADLRALAVAGAEAYRTLLTDADTRDRLSGWLSGDAVARGRPAVIQLARAANTRLAFPWQLVYDLPVIGDGSTLAPCPSAFIEGEPPPGCPHADRHRDGDGALCPYGFWGLAHVLEVPPFTAAGLVEETGEPPPPTLAVGFNASLAGAAWDRHRARLAAITGGPPAVATTVERLRAALGTGSDVVYLLCHGTRVPGVPGGPPTVTLDFGDGGRIAPGDVDAWSRLNPPVRWTDRRPLVVLNGCFTGEVLPDTTAEFVAAFVGQSGAAGVLATEVTVEMRLAVEAMELFLAGLWRGLGVGAALRSVRWTLLRRGNIMGLAYSPYCDADLRVPVLEGIPL